MFINLNVLTLLSIFFRLFYQNISLRMLITFIFFCIFYIYFFIFYNNQILSPNYFFIWILWYWSFTFNCRIMTINLLFLVIKQFKFFFVIILIFCFLCYFLNLCIFFIFFNYVLHHIINFLFLHISFFFCIFQVTLKLKRINDKSHLVALLSWQSFNWFAFLLSYILLVCKLSLFYSILIKSHQVLLIFYVIRILATLILS